MLLLALGLIPVALLVAAVAFRRRLTRRRVVVGLVVFMLAIAGGLTWSLTQANKREALAAKIIYGMTREEVIEILGPSNVRSPTADVWYFADGPFFVAYDSRNMRGGVISSYVVQSKATLVRWYELPEYWFNVLTGW